MHSVSTIGLSFLGTRQVGAAAYANELLATGQTACYSIGDDGDVEAGDAKSYTVTATAGTTDIQVATYAGNTLSFAAPNTIADAAGGLGNWAVNDRMVIKGSGSNDGEVTVTGIAGAPANLTISAAVNEAAGAMISLYKTAALSNNVVTDNKTGLMWARYTSNGLALGPNSNGTLVWYSNAAAYLRTLYAVGNTVSVIMPGNIFRVVGGAALTQFHVGDCIQAAGFANAVNNQPNMVVVSATPNGADLDIVVDPGNQVLVAEGAVGDFLYLNCRSIFNYAAGANLGSLGGYTDWRPPNYKELDSLIEIEAPNALPDAVAFPGWSTAGHWSTSVRSDSTNNKIGVSFSYVAIGQAAMTATNLCALVRLGT